MVRGYTMPTGWGSVIAKWSSCYLLVRTLLVNDWWAGLLCIVVMRIRNCSSKIRYRFTLGTTNTPRTENRSLLVETTEHTRTHRLKLRIRLTVGFIHLTTAHYLSIQVGARARWFGSDLRGYYVRVGWWISTDWPGLVMIMMLMMMTTACLPSPTIPYQSLQASVGPA